jgi:hypothetical protein
MEPVDENIMSDEEKRQYTSYLNEYIQQQYSKITKEQAYRVGYLGAYDIHSDGSLISYSVENNKTYKMFDFKYSNSKKVVLRYSGNFTLQPNPDVTSNCSLVVSVADALLNHMSKVNNILSSNKNKAAFYDVFIEKNNNAYSIRHVVRTFQGVVYILNEDLELKEAYYTHPAFSKFKKLDIEQAKIAVLFFTLVLYGKGLSEVLNDTHSKIENFTIDEMQQYIDVNEMVQY